MDSVEYKQQCVHTLCHCEWKERQFVQLAAMFKDMHLSRDDHKLVVNKICSYIIDVPPDSLPPLVHQLLKLCKLYDLEIVLGHLSQYFSMRLYSKLEPPAQDSESTTMDIDDIVPHSPAELSRCLSTCIYHISQGVAEPELVRKHIKMWPKTQLLRTPFVMDVALALSDKGADFRSACLDVIKAAIEQRELDELRSKESAWVRSVLPPDVDVTSVLKVLTTESANHRQLTVIGLINLAFSLLSVARTKPVAPSCWSHGKLILVRLSKSQPETAAHILSQLADKLAGYCSQRQYADCLYVLCKLTPVSLERCTQLSTILENCQPSPADYKAAAAVLDAVHPLLNFSTRTRDTLVMVCRKGLHSRDSVHRCLALSGFLSVLRHVRLSRGCSQPASELYSAHSYLTQLTVDLHATQQGTVVTSRVRNEAMCMEVLSILRRCLVQDALVKELLYTNIYECTKEKPALHEPMLELLYEHLNKYVPEDRTGPTTGPLDFDKCVQINAVTAVLVEPISRLLYATAQFLQPMEEEDLEDILTSESLEPTGAHLKNKLKTILEQICSSDQFGEIDLENQSLTDLTPESKAKSLIVQQTLQCYETLIAYKIMQWNASSDNVANSVHKLYKGYDQLLQKTKVVPKSVKKRRKSLNETAETSKSQKSQKTQKPNGKSPTKLTNLVKDRAGPFKPLPCVWDLKFCVRIIELLYSEDVSWSSMEQRNSIRGRKEFQHWTLRCVLSVLSNEHIEKRLVASYVVDLARILYHRCVCRFQNMYDFDEQTTLSCIDVFRTCLTLLLSSTYSLKMEFFLPTITGLSESSPSEAIAAILEQISSALTETDAGDESDAPADRVVSALIQTATVLLNARVPCCAQLTTVIVKLEDYIRRTKQDSLSLIPALLTAGCRDQQESQLLDDLLLKFTTALGLIDEEGTTIEEDSSTFPTIDSRTGHTVLAHVCSHLGDRFKYAEHLLHRARDLTAAFATATRNNQNRIDKEVKEVYKSLVIQLCQLSGWVCGVCRVRVSAGGGGGGALGACVRLYALLAALARHLQPRTAALVRFERLLKLSGKKLSSVTDNLITYLEASQQQQKASKVLRDTKLIPRLVLEAEQFSKNVILLANKGKFNWQQYLSLGTARDFRIKGPVLQEVLNAREARIEDADETRDEDDREVNDQVALLTPIQTLHVGEKAGDKHKSKKRRIQ
ncbi:Fanconi anemia group I protein homolog isoform X2 [Manduca sexta]|nr:Fanconi anemia group I protein homolog isoform X2 [Manduca sexta]